MTTTATKRPVGRPRLYRWERLFDGRPVAIRCYDKAGKNRVKQAAHMWARARGIKVRTATGIETVTVWLHITKTKTEANDATSNSSDAA